MNLRRILAAFAALACALPAAAQEFPTKPIRMIVPYAAGGPTDIRARLVADKMAQYLGQPVIVEARPGGNTFIGARAVAEAAPDGYTVLIHSSSLSLGPLTFKNPGYSMDQFAVFAPVTIAPFILSVGASTPFRTVGELVAFAKANPGKLTNGSLGGAGQSQLLTERFKDVAGGLQFIDVPYKGAAQAIQAVMSGDITMYMDSLQTSVPASRSGKTRLLAITGERRVAEIPDIPTFKELGFNVVGGTWTALFAPAKTPPAVLARLAREGVRATQADGVREKLYDLGSEPWKGTVAEFAQYIKDDAAQWEKDLRRLKIPMQD